VRQSEIIQQSAAISKEGTGWGLKSLEATFGLTLTAEAGVILSRDVTGGGDRALSELRGGG
jgi:hypothetical protein